MRAFGSISIFTPFSSTNSSNFPFSSVKYEVPQNTNRSKITCTRKFHDQHVNKIQIYPLFCEIIPITIYFTVKLVIWYIITFLMNTNKALTSKR